MWTGVRFVPWIRLLARHRFRVATSRVPRALGITAASFGTEVLTAIQRVIWGRGIRRARIAADPIGVLRGCYDHFGWPGRAEAEPAWRAHLDAERGYRRHERAIDERLRDRVARELGEVLDRHGYGRR